MKKIIAALALAGMAWQLGQAATSDTVLMTVSISNQLAISVDESIIGFGEFSLAGAGRVVTQSIKVVNAATSIVADISLSASKFSEVDGSLSFAQTIDGSVAQDYVELAGVFVSIGSNAVSPTAAANFEVADIISDGGVKEATNGASGTCTDNDNYCLDAVVYNTQAVGSTNFYIGDGQNLSMGESISLRLWFKPPSSMTFDAQAVTSTLYVSASIGGSEE